ncbi:MAG: FemAB family PEP-CTERM system-associated protein [Dehalococcoidia bacterium]|nr:FemAB family PEP-CTERM system-associated protein [Dehalococcoidia bacterium]
MEIKLLQNESDEKRWDDFVRGNVSCIFYHQIGWRNVIEKVYHHKPYYLFAEEDNQIVGILPLFLIKDILWGKRLVSLPFAPFANACADDENAARLLINESETLAKDLNVDYLEFRARSNNADFPTDSTFVTSILKLEPDPEFIFKNLPQNKRRNITKSMKRGLTVEWADKLKDFYLTYSRNMQDLGTPPHSYRFFDNILSEFPDNSTILTVKREGVIVYSAFLLFYKGTVIDFMSSTIEEYRKYYPTDFGIWNAITYACEKGFTYFDFGRSIKDSSNHEFKRRWGAETQQLYYHYYLNKAHNLPHLNPSNPKYERLSKIWRRLPLVITNRLGPIIRQYIV